MGGRDRSEARGSHFTLCFAAVAERLLSFHLRFMDERLTRVREWQAF